MSRKINPNFRWGKILKRFRLEAGLNQTEIAEAIGYRGDSKGNISEIEKGKLLIDETKVRTWVSKCNKTMQEFYLLATELDTRLDTGLDILEPAKSSKKSR